MSEKIWLSSPHLGNKEIVFLNEAIDSNWIAPLGPMVDGLENDICKYLEVQHAVVLNSGTSAMHLALKIAGVKTNDFVICPSFTFVAVVNPVLYLFANPVLIDSESTTWNMSPEYAAHAIDYCLRKGKKPKAMIVAHHYGMPSMINELLAVAGKHNITIIEDAADALGSTYDRKACGTFGHLGVLSFNGNKIITTSGGGALISENEKYISKARFLATQARDAAPHYEHSEVGYNYRMSNVCAAIGRGQMEVLDKRIAQRRKVFAYYVEALSGVEGITFLQEPEDSFSNRWLTCILVDPKKTNGITREDIRLALEKENIESRPLWKPMHLQPVFKDALYFGEKLSERLFENGLCLPSGSNLTESDLQRVVDAVMKVLK